MNLDSQTNDYITLQEEIEYQEAHGLDDDEYDEYDASRED